MNTASHQGDIGVALLAHREFARIYNDCDEDLRARLVYYADVAESVYVYSHSERSAFKASEFISSGDDNYIPWTVVALLGFFYR